MHGSNTKHNAAERGSAENWAKLCFPRFYFYDVLRGLSALLTWAEKTERAIPLDAVREVVSSLNERFPDGLVKNERRSFDVLLLNHNIWPYYLYTGTK